MYAFMALAGDIGCSAGPTVVGMIASANEDQLKIGLIFAMIFPVIILLGITMLRNKKRQE